MSKKKGKMMGFWVPIWGVGFRNPLYHIVLQAFTDFFCDPGRTRTCDPQLRRLLLYPAELRDHFLMGSKSINNLYNTIGNT